MGMSKMSSRRLQAGKKRQRALALRLQGKSFRAIASEMGVSPQRAWKITNDAVQENARERHEQAAEVMELETKRLDLLLEAHLPRSLGQVKNEQGKLLPPSVESGTFVLKIMERRAKLWGLDAATKVNGSFAFAHLQDLSDEELEAAATRIGLKIETQFPPLETSLPVEVPLIEYTPESET